LLPIVRLHPAVLAWAGQRRKAEVWGVAFSGGADSLALLLLLRAHFPQRKLVAWHFNHRLRGRAADADERFCRSACTALGVSLRVGRWNRVGRALRPTVGRKARPTVSEAESRFARHGFFAKEMKRLHTKALWLAHQQDDIAETMLMRLARGSGTGGLAAPRPVQMMGDGRVHLRPLLPMKKSQLVAALKQAGVRWREDASNAGSDHFRNRVRAQVLPAWIKAAGRDALAGAALSRELLEEDDVALELWADAILRPDRAGAVGAQSCCVPVSGRSKTAPLRRRRTLDVAALAGLPRAVTRRILHRWLLAVRPETDLSRQGFNQLLAAVERGRDTRFSLGANGFAVVRRGQLKFRGA